MSEMGLGCADARLKVYIANRPPLPHYQALQGMQLMTTDEINNVVEQSGNHWRKIFNVYAKLLFLLQPDTRFERWQCLRDQALLRQPLLSVGDEQLPAHALLFTPPRLQADASTIHLVMGKGYASVLALPALEWLDGHFAWHQQSRLIVCPYFDYRQLSNARIVRLAELIQQVGLA